MFENGLKYGARVMKTMLWCFLIYAVCISHAYGEHKIRFEHPLNTGAYNIAIAQDHDGFIWAGHSSGLTKFDGYQTKVYTAGPNSVSSNHIVTIFVDDEGLLWLGTMGGGLDMYDKKTDTFTVFKYDEQNPNSINSDHFNWAPHTIDQDQEGLLWFATQDGICSYDKTTQTFTRYRHDPNNPNSLSDNNTWTIFVDQDNDIWIGTNSGGLNCFNKRTQTFTHYLHDPQSTDDSKNLGAGKVYAVTQDKEGYLWIGTEKGGLIRFDTNTETFVHYRHDPENPESIAHDEVFYILVDSQDNLWLCRTYSVTIGVEKFEKKTGKFALYNHDPDNPDSLSDNVVQGVFEDHAGTIWFALTGAVDTYNEQMQRFGLYQHNPKDTSSIGLNIVAIYEDRERTIWFCDQNGLYRYNQDTDDFTFFGIEPDDPESFHAFVFSAYQDSDGVFWVSTKDGTLQVFDRNTGKVVQRYENPYLTNEEMEGIAEDVTDSNILWLGTLDSGLFTFEKDTGTFTQFKHDPDDPASISNNVVISGVFQEPDGTIWVPTGRGLNKFDREKQTFIKYLHEPDNPESLSGNAVTSCDIDSFGNFWVSTDDGGLNKFFKDTGTFKRYGREHGFTTNVLRAILEDSEGNLWLTSDSGIFKFNIREEWVVNIYTKADGLQGDQFKIYSKSALKSSDGRMWFAGLNGVSAFYPEQIQDNPYQPPVYLSSLKQGGEEISFGKAIERVKDLNLTWQQNFFEFEFVALNYILTPKNRYKYILEGFDKAWYDSGTRRFGRYSNLPGGTYTLRILGSNNDGVWNEEDAAITITVGLPFWKTWWFYALVILSVSGLTGFIYHQHINRLRAEQAAALAQMEKEFLAKESGELARAKEEAEAAKEKAEIANRAKSEFLANMSHELRTPLNSILGFAQIMARNPNLPPEEQENLSIIQRSGEHLLRLINQVLDLSKIEAGRITLDEKNFDLYHLLDELENMFRLRFEKKGLQLLFERADDVLQYVRTDQVKLRQVIINLLNNAVKFTEEGGVAVRVNTRNVGVLEYWSTGKESTHPPTPTLQYSNTPILLSFEIEDTGYGIAPEELNTLFEAFTQTETGRQSQEGTGLGLPISRKFVQLMGGDITVKSEVGHGTIFMFDIQVDVVKAEELERFQEPRRTIALEPGQPRYRMLIVDDKQDNRQLLIKMLKPFGFELREADNGQEAIDIWQEWEPHLIWMDLRMPVMSGYEATQQIRATDKGKDTVIITLSASSFEEERAIALSQGCDDFLRKPFQEHEIVDLLHKHLGVRFVYEEEQQVAGRRSQVAGEEVLTPEALIALPQEVLVGLEQTVNILDINGTNRIIEKIRPQNALLAETLAELVKGHRFDVLQDVFETWRNYKNEEIKKNPLPLKRTDLFRE